MKNRRKLLTDEQWRISSHCRLLPEGGGTIVADPDAALTLLAPVLVERATQGGVRVYHESFARYLRRVFDRDGPALRAVLERIAAWLEGKGLFVDPRSFRSLLSILAESGNDRRVIELVDRAFVSKAVAAGFPASAIAENLAVAVGSAARIGEWAVIVRCVEAARAAQMYEYERFDSLLVSFADVPASLIGVDTLATRLVNDDRLVMPARVGLQMCASVDRLGATAPWRPYMLGHIREAKNDNTSYGGASGISANRCKLQSRKRRSSPSIAARLRRLQCSISAKVPYCLSLAPGRCGNE